MKGYLYVGTKITRLGFWKPSSTLVCILDSQTLPFKSLFNKYNTDGKKLLLEPPDFCDFPTGSLLEVESVEIEYVRDEENIPKPIYNVYCFMVNKNIVSQKRLDQIISEYCLEDNKEECHESILENAPNKPGKRSTKRGSDRVKQVRKKRVCKPKDVQERSEMQSTVLPEYPKTKCRTGQNIKTRGEGEINVPTECPQHPNYKAIRKPKVTINYPTGCEICWKIYNSKH